MGRATVFLSTDEGRNLSGQGAADPDRADRALFSLRTFREALHACLLAEESSAAWPVEKQASIKDALRHGCLSKQDGLFGWQVSFETCGLDLILNRLSIAAEALLRSDDIARIKTANGAPGSLSIAAADARDDGAAWQPAAAGPNPPATIPITGRVPAGRPIDPEMPNCHLLMASQGLRPLLPWIWGSAPETTFRPRRHFEARDVEHHATDFRISRSASN